MNTKDIGNRSEAVLLAILVQSGYNVLCPFGDNLRYDLALDINGKLIRIQCKTGRLVKGAIQFATASSQAHRGKGRKTYYGQADYFGVYSPDMNKCYIISVNECGRNTTFLRVKPTQSGQKQNVRWASDYEIEKFHLPILVSKESI